jgi:ATP-binding cassette subfamily F protein uup
VVTSTLVFTGDGRIAEYAGGYDDWRRQQQKAPETVAGRIAPAKKPVPKRVSSSGKKKLGFNEQRELAALPAGIEALEQEQQTLYAQMSAPDFYTQEGPVIAASKQHLEAIEVRIEQAYKRWEELQKLAEAT